MLIDTHAHLNFNAFKDDADEVIRRSLDNNIWMINVGSQYETSKRAVEIAEKHERGVFASVGLHPIHLATDLVKIKNDTEEIDTSTSSVSTSSSSSSLKTHQGLNDLSLRAEGLSKAERVEIKTKEENFGYDRYKDLVRSTSSGQADSKVVAIGEVGLDYYWKPKTKGKLELFKEKQRNVLCQQLKLAKELNLPVIFHCRMAHKDLIQFLKENEESRPPQAVAHGFVGNSNELKEYLNFGYHIGFNGIIFKKIEGIDFEENIRQTPLERILIETDCPYLTPPLPAEALAKAGLKEGRNEPLYIEYVARKIAEIKNIDFEKVAEITFQNAKNLFKI